MNLKRIWAPWRVSYVTRISKKPKGCIFCRMIKQKEDRANLIFRRSAKSFAVLNIYPYNNGHCLVVPKRHVQDLRDLRQDEREDLFALVMETQGLLDRTIRPGGYNIGINCGRIAGAGFPGHVHIHIVPRWKGDVNFMPVTAYTKVISQSLEALYDGLMGCRGKKKTK